MKAQWLIDSMVRQVTVLIAQLATSGGIRAPVANVANQVLPCTDEDYCAEGSLCRGAAEKRTCQEIVVVRDGDTCDEAEGGLSPRFCEPGAFCAEGGRCERTDGREGSSCLAKGPSAARCQHGLYCDEWTNRCKRQVAAGESCLGLDSEWAGALDDACISGTCNDETRLCEARGCFPW